LPAAALDYAAEDVEHLLPACRVLSERLEARGRLAWATEDSARLLDPALYRSDADNAVERVKGARSLRGRARRAAVGLASWRERTAEQSDRPRQWILRDAVLLEIATADPASRAALAEIAGLPAATARRAGDELLGILHGARASRDDYEPPARPDEAEKALMKAMQQKVAKHAVELDIAAEVLAPRKDLSAALAGKRDVRVFSGWRRQVIGDELLQMLAGQDERHLYRLDQAPIHLIDAAVRIDRLQLAALPVELHQRLGLLAIHVEAAANRFLVVVVALQQFATGIATGVQFFLRRKMDIQHFAGHRAAAASRQALHQNIEFDVHQHRRMQRPTQFVQQIVQIQRLLTGARKSVEDEAFRGIFLREPLADDAEHDLVRHELPRFHDVFRLLAETRAGIDGRAQDIAGRNLGNVALGLELAGLGALA
jgi:hypothetical protein